MLSGEEEEETQSSADDLTPSVTSHEASDLFPSQSGRRCPACSSAWAGASKALVMQTGVGALGYSGEITQTQMYGASGVPCLYLSLFGVFVSLASEPRLFGFSLQEEGMC